MAGTDGSEGPLDPPVAAHQTARQGPGERSWSDRRHAGRALREAAPRRSHGTWSPAPDRVDPVEQLLRTDADREPELVPVRVARMAASPFAYYRGAADMMTFDLVPTPRSGISAQLCGDAHCLNFGFYGSPTGLVVFDINDFDETAMGPWEWDLKRLAVSLVLAGRGNGASDEESRVAVLAAVRAYRKVAESFRDTSVLDLWRLAVDDHSPLLHRYGRDDAVFRRGFASARRHDNVAALSKLTEVVDGHRRFRAEPPLLSAPRAGRPPRHRGRAGRLPAQRADDDRPPPGRPRHRRRGAEGRGRRQRRHAGLRRAPGPTGRERSAVPAAEGGRALGRAARRATTPRRPTRASGSWPVSA